MKRNDDSKIRCPFRGTITILKTFGMWLTGCLFLLSHKIRKINLTAFSRMIIMFLALIVICGAERQTVIQKEGRVISKTMNLVMIGSTQAEEEISREVENANTLKPNEEIANEIILGLWGNGDERRNRLIEAGYDPEAIQIIVESKVPKKVSEPVTSSTVSKNGGAVLTKHGGICYNNPYGYKETWYSQKVLPGGGLKIPGRHVDSRGLVCDEEGYICVAVSVNDPQFYHGSILETSLGLAKVYDHGCALGVIDVYVDW